MRSSRGRNPVPPAAMRVYATRDSVAAGDDADAPHARTFTVPDGSSLQDCLSAVLAGRYLPDIDGGLATWSVASSIPLATIAQQWPAPRMRFLTRSDLAQLDFADSVLRLHFNYHAQLDPELVATVLGGLRLRAEA